MSRVLALLIAGFMTGLSVGAADDPIVIRGILYSGGAITISAEMPGLHGAKWITTGEAIGPWVFDKADLASNRFGFTDDRGESLSVQLSEAAIKDARDAWIRSTANPMFYAAARLPQNVLTRWSGMSEVEHARIKAYYRNHGWIMEVLEADENHMSMRWSAIHEEERAAERRRESNAFRATLTGDEAAAYDASHNARPINFTKLDPANPPRNLYRDFLETLSPEHREAWEQSNQKWSQGPEFDLPPG